MRRAVRSCRLREERAHRERESEQRRAVQQTAHKEEDERRN